MITLKDIQELSEKGLITQQQALDITKAYGFATEPEVPDEAVLQDEPPPLPEQHALEKNEDSFPQEATPEIAKRMEPVIPEPPEEHKAKTLLVSSTPSMKAKPPVPLVPRKQVNYLAIVFASLGGLLTIGGISTLAVTYWWDIPAWVKLLGAILVMYAFWGVGFFQHEVRKTAIKTGYACCMVGACMWGACNKLFAYLYHVSTVPSNGILCFLLGVLPFPWIIRLRGLFMLLIASCFLWAGLVIHENPGAPSTYFLIPGLALVCSGLGYLLGHPRVLGGSYTLYAPMAGICGTWFFAVGFPLSVFQVPSWSMWGTVCMLAPCLQFILGSFRKNISMQAAALLSLMLFIILSFKANAMEESGAPILLHLLLICLPVAMGLFLRCMKLTRDTDTLKVITFGIWAGVISAMTIAALQYQGDSDSVKEMVVSLRDLSLFKIKHAIPLQNMLQYIVLWIFPAIMVMQVSREKPTFGWSQGLAFVFILLALLSPSLDTGFMPQGGFGILALLLLACGLLGWRGKATLPRHSLALVAFLLCAYALTGDQLSAQNIILMVIPALFIGMVSQRKEKTLPLWERDLLYWISCASLGFISLNLLISQFNGNQGTQLPSQLLILLFLGVPLLPFLARLFVDVRNRKQEPLSRCLWEWCLPCLVIALYLCFFFGEYRGSQLLALASWAVLMTRQCLPTHAGVPRLLSPEAFLKGRMIRPISSRLSIAVPLVILVFSVLALMVGSLESKMNTGLSLTLFTLLPLGMCACLTFLRSLVKSHLMKITPGFVTAIIIGIISCIQVAIELGFGDLGASRWDILLLLWGVALFLSWFFRNRSVWNWCLIGLGAQIILLLLPVEAATGVFIVLCIPALCGVRPTAKYALLPIVFLAILLMGQIYDFGETILFAMFPLAALFAAGKAETQREKSLAPILYLFFIAGSLLVPDMGNKGVEVQHVLGLCIAFSIISLWILRMVTNTIARREAWPDGLRILQYVAFITGFVVFLLNLKEAFLIAAGVFLLAGAIRLLTGRKQDRATVFTPIMAGFLSFALLQYVGYTSTTAFSIPVMVAVLSFLSYAILMRLKWLYSISLFCLQLSILHVWSELLPIPIEHLWLVLSPLVVPGITLAAHALRNRHGSLAGWGNMAYLLSALFIFSKHLPSHFYELSPDYIRIALGFWLAGIILQTLRDGEYRSLFNAVFSSLLLSYFLIGPLEEISMAIGFFVLMISWFIAKGKGLPRIAIICLAIALFLGQLCCYKWIGSNRYTHIESIILSCLPGVILMVQLRTWVPRLGMKLSLLFSLAMVGLVAAVPILPPFGSMLVLVFCGAAAVLSGLKLARASIINCGVILIALVAASLAINLLDSVTEKGLGLLICGLTLLGLAYITERTRRALISRMHPVEHQDPS